MFAPHFNIGYTFSSDSGNDFINVTDEFNYVFGTEFVVSPEGHDRGRCCRPSVQGFG